MTQQVLDTITIGDQVKMMRTLRGLSQQELGARTGLSQFVISFFETNRADRTTQQLAAIKTALRWREDAEEAFAILEGVELPPL